MPQGTWCRAGNLPGDRAMAMMESGEEPLTTVPELDLSRAQRVHIVGVGGAGMSAIATVLASMGHTVTGSDLKGSRTLERVRAQGVDVRVGHAAGNVGDVDAVAVSTAIPPTNPEVVAATERGIPVLRRADVLAAICSTRRTIAVAGTHGKTTTSSMLALALGEAGFRPSFIIGGDVNEIGTGAVWSDGDWFVVEADESDGTFLELGAEAVIVTSVEPDHLDHYGGRFEVLQAAFERFVAEASGPRVVCADDPVAVAIVSGGAVPADAVTYGTTEGADYRMVDVHGDRAGVRFTVEHGGGALGDLHVPVPGLHNARNATAALAAAMELGAPFDAVARALGRYGGVSRRFEFRGQAGGVTFVDDYAHLPGEIRSALAAAREGGWDRVVCVFQPHRYTRTASLWETFGDAFDDADLLVVTDVFSAGEAPRPGITGKLVVDAVLAHDPWKPVAYLPHRADLAPYLRARLRPGDVCLTLGAGDITSLADELLAPPAGQGAA